MEQNQEVVLERDEEVVAELSLDELTQIGGGIVIALL